MRNYTIALLAVTSLIVLTGCQTPPKTLYQWGDYQPEVYQYFKGESPEQQIIIMEKNLEIIKSKDGKVAPGYHAHLGFLYSLTGKTDQVAKEFQIEKQLFPESAAYMDFLLKKVNKSEN